MGSGSSKAKSNNVRKTIISGDGEPVANVNKTQSQSQSNIASPVINDNLTFNSPVKTAEGERYPVLQASVDKNDKNVKTVSRNSEKVDAPTALTFEDESDVENDIDEVLKIPMAIGRAKQNRNNEKNGRQEKNKENVSSTRITEFSSQASKASVTAEPPLPETYAQRQQRQQYKLQKNVLLSENVQDKKPVDWQQYDDDMVSESPQDGFDASKFRAANRGGGIKRDLFTTKPEEIRITHYQHSTVQDFTDFDFKTREVASLNRPLPRYDQSELDLMHQLEQEM